MKVEERDFVVLNNQDQKIFAVLHRPLISSPAPAVLICHGLAGDKTGRYRVYVNLSKQLSQMGIASLRVDFRGSGDSEGEFSDVTLSSEVSDALKGLEYLKQSPYIDSNRIGVFGRSFGGSVGLIAAKLYGDIKSLVTWAPLADGDQWRELWDRVHAPGVTDEQRTAVMRVNGQLPSRDFFHQLFNMHIGDEIKALDKLPLLHIHGEKDTVVTIDHAYKYKKFRQAAKGKSKFITLPESDHDFTDPAEQLLAIEETCRWFAETL